MDASLVKCAMCRKIFSRRRGQVKEAKKFGWRQFCSVLCMAKSKMTGMELKCANDPCGNIIYRPPKEIKKVTKSFCSHSCSATIINRLRASLIPANYCSYIDCGLKIPRYQKYCSRLHASRARKFSEAAQRQGTINKITAFYKQHKRIPVKREMYGLYKGAREAFGTWNKAILAAGLTPNPVIFAERQIANDGHMCDSMIEKIIDDWFFNKSIPHKRKIPYPENKKLTTDFVVGDKWIEFFGLAGELKEYDRIIKKKRAICRKHKIQLVEIYPKDLFPARKREKLFSQIFV